MLFSHVVFFIDIALKSSKDLPPHEKRIPACIFELCKCGSCIWRHIGRDVRHGSGFGHRPGRDREKLEFFTQEDDGLLVKKRQVQWMAEPIHHITIYRVYEIEIARAQSCTSIHAGSDVSAIEVFLCTSEEREHKLKTLWIRVNKVYLFLLAYIVIGIRQQKTVREETQQDGLR